MMSEFEQPKTFQANPGPLKKRLFQVAGTAGLLAIIWAASTKGTNEYGAFAFAGGITAVVFSLRFYLMIIRHGPMAMTFASDGITLANKASSHTVGWADLKAIRYMVSRGGHYWEVASRAQSATLDFYLDGLTHQQQEALRTTITSIDLPDVEIVPVYDPFGKAA